MQLLEYLKEERGRASAMALALGVSPVLVSQWANKHRAAPAARCPDIERHTDGAVTCEDLRPDVDWSYLRGGAPRRIDTPEAAAAVLGVARAASSAPEDPACIDLPLDDACNDPDDALQPGELDPPTLDPDDPNYDPDADRLGPAEETA